MANNIVIPEETLKNATDYYWDITHEDYICKPIKELYDKSLLQAELDWAKNHDQIKIKPCETLVLLVGLSLEPLLQSVCVYKPQKVMLILNKDGYTLKEHEEWDVFARFVIEMIKKLHEKSLIEKNPQFLGENGLGFPTPDNPDDVFGTLVKVLHDEKDAVIDMTGGKKSMVTGAFLYAAYSGIRISYVDFENYNAKHRRPYGYTCKIGELTNPYQKFALREWERVRELYEKYQFEEAARVLSNITETMRKVIPESGELVKKLKSYFDYYAKWDRGDFYGARQAAISLGFPEELQPTAVVELGDGWYQIEGSEFRYKNKAKDFYGNEKVIQIYVCDEIERIGRLIEKNEDYRSAFVRAGGVNEIIMLARIVAMITSSIDKDKFLEPLDDKTPFISSIFESLTNEKNQIEVGKKKDISFTNAPEITIPKPSRMKEWWTSTKLFKTNKGWDKFLTYRNHLMHKYFSVPREWAEDGLGFVKANFEDFLGHPMSDLGICTEELPWKELCNLCGISRYLPPNLR